MKVMRRSVMTVMMLAMMGVQDTFGARCPEGQVHISTLGRCGTCDQTQYFKWQTGECFSCGHYMLDVPTTHRGIAPYGLRENIYGYCHRGNCPAGEYGSSPTDCTTCPAGYFQRNNHQTACTACVAGRYRIYGPGVNAVCRECPVGYYNDEPGNPQMSCKECAAGYYSNEIGAAECTACEAGKSNLNNTCVNCAVGYYNDEPGQSSCKECADGYYSNEIGATECTACEAGRYSGPGANAVCEECLIGYYNDEPGQMSCKRCADDGLSLIHI